MKYRRMDLLLALALGIAVFAGGLTGPASDDDLGDHDDESGRDRDRWKRDASEPRGHDDRHGHVPDDDDRDR